MFLDQTKRSQQPQFKGSLWLVISSVTNYDFQKDGMHHDFKIIPLTQNMRNAKQIFGLNQQETVEQDEIRKHKF